MASLPPLSSSSLSSARAKDSPRELGPTKKRAIGEPLFNITKGSLRKEKSLSANLHSHLGALAASAQGSSGNLHVVFNFSPRSKPESINTLSEQMREHFSRPMRENCEKLLEEYLAKQSKEPYVDEEKKSLNQQLKEDLKTIFSDPFFSENIETQLDEYLAKQPKEHCLEESKKFLSYQLKEYLKSIFPDPLFQVLAQISYDQYIFISSDPQILITGLAKKDLLKTFVLAAAHLITPESALAPIFKKRLIKVSLNIIELMHMENLIDAHELKNEIDFIHAAHELNFKSPKFQNLIYSSEDAAILREKIKTPSQEIAKSGLNYLEQLIRDPQDEKELILIKSHCQDDPLATQKIFLFAIDFFLLKKNHLHPNEPQKESLIQYCLNIFLSSEGQDLLNILKIKKIAKQILLLCPRESLSSDSAPAAANHGSPFKLPQTPSPKIGQNFAKPLPLLRFSRTPSPVNEQKAQQQIGPPHTPPPNEKGAFPANFPQDSISKCERDSSKPLPRLGLPRTPPLGEQETLLFKLPQDSASESERGFAKQLSSLKLSRTPSPAGEQNIPKQISPFKLPQAFNLISESAAAKQFSPLKVPQSPRLESRLSKVEQTLPSESPRLYESSLFLEAPSQQTRQLMLWTAARLNNPSTFSKIWESSEQLAKKGLNFLTNSMLDSYQKSFTRIQRRDGTGDLSIQKIFLSSVYFFVLKKNRLNLDEMQKESLIQLSLKIFLSPEGEELLNLLKTQKIAEEILSFPLVKPANQETRQLLQETKIRVSTPFISLQELQFLLFWIQTPLEKIDNSSDLAAGTREWDPHGKLYLFALSRCINLVKEPDFKPETPLQLIYFISCWREAPANQDLLEKAPFSLAWKGFMDSLETWDPDGKLYHLILSRCIELAEAPHFKPDVLRYLMRFIIYSRTIPTNKDLLSKREFSEIWEKLMSLLEEKKDRSFFSDSFLSPKINSPSAISNQISLSNIYSNNPLSASKELNSPVPEKILNLWNKPSIAMKLKSSIIFHLLAAREQVSMENLFSHSEIKGEAILAKHCDQVVQFLVGQLLAAKKEELPRLVHILCNVQKEFLEHSAFEAALALHSVFQCRPIERLKFLFTKEPPFSEVFEIPTVLRCEINNAKELRELQKQNPNSLDVSALLFKDLTHIRESPIYTEKGEVNTEKLQIFGKIFNHYCQRKQETLIYWTSRDKRLKPNPILLQALNSQTGKIDDEVLDLWWKHSKEKKP